MKETDTKACDTRFKQNTPPLTADNTAAPRETGVTQERKYYAHSLEGEPVEKWQLLKDHLLAVAELAKEFASFFNKGELAYIAGLFHDLGKYAEQFQRRLENPHKEKGRDHSIAGAALVLSLYKGIAEEAALAIEGHHIGLQKINNSVYDWLRDISNRLQSHRAGEIFTETDFSVLLAAFKKDKLMLPARTVLGNEDILHNLEMSAAAMLDVRMLYSALVDADFLDTEAYFNATDDEPLKYRPRGPQLMTSKALDKLKSYLSELQSQSDSSLKINKVRNLFMDIVVDSASNDKGLFTLTAPTGCGKTLAMLRFALEHAHKHAMRRIIIIIPYLNIIEQTAKIYQQKLFSISDGFSGNFVLEDHSFSKSISNEKDDYEDEVSRISSLLSENWDAPIILTTSVAFLESIMAAKSSACRKLHRLADSVILFDEVQTLPPKLITPTLATLSRLADRDGPYGCSIVFSTATQPAFEHLDKFVRSINKTRGWKPMEIVKDADALFKSFSGRVKVDWRYDKPISVENLGKELLETENKRFMCIVNLKRHSQELFEALDNKGRNLYHLSTNMCPAHRKKVLYEISESMDIKRPVCLVATQCVEAGVDLDFPVVYRAFAPLDSLAQAAGRCNRNGKLNTAGQMVVFQFESADKALFPPGYREGMDNTKIFLQHLIADGLNLNETDIFNNPELLKRYYKQFYNMTGRGSNELEDEEKLHQAIIEGNFAEVAKLYKLIDNNTINVLVPYDCGLYEELIEQMQPGAPRTLEGVRCWIQRARAITVGVYKPSVGSYIWNHLEPIYFSNCVDKNIAIPDWYKPLPGIKYEDRTGLKLPEDNSLWHV